MRLEEKPVYTVYVIGFPEDYVEFYPEAARQLGVNLNVEFHGNEINTLYSDEYGFEITDAGVESLRVEEENAMARVFYRAELGTNWLEKVHDRAMNLLAENQWENDLPF